MHLCQIPYDTAKAAENMAIDSALLEFGFQTGQAMWRLYGWAEPAVTFGYSQQWEWIQSQFPDFEGALIRRLTGGGVVDHRKDLTYALSLPPTHEAYRAPAPDLYQNLHQRIAAIFLDHGFQAALQECQKPCGDTPPARPAGICFQSAEPFDVIHPVTGVKLAGAAMKRSRMGILIQGSLNLRPLPGLQREEFATSLNAQLAVWLGLEPVAFTGKLSPEVLVREWKRFSSKEWNRRR